MLFGTRKLWLALLALSCQVIGATAQTSTPPRLETLLPGADTVWVSTTLKAMSLEEKIGQLFMVQTWTKPYFGGQKVYNRDQVEALIKDQHVGGVIFMQGGPISTAWHANRYQSLSKLPLLVSADYEWGLSMRLDSTLVFPRNIALGAIQNDSLLFRMGREMAREARAIGVHVDFAPVVDINNNPANPVIGDRSFGEDMHLVTQKALMMMQGLRAGKVIACAKHFPGHGDTDVDSHKDLPVLDHTTRRLDSLELYPFKELIRYGVPSVMVGHLFIPSLDTTTNRASTLSPQVVNGMLRGKMQFGGLIFTDALNMQALTKYNSQASLAVQAILAGNDILLCPEEVELSIDSIKAAIEKGVLTVSMIDSRVKKILLAKSWLGLDKKRLVDTGTVDKMLNRPEALALQRELYAAAMTLVQNRGAAVPIKNLEKQKLLYIQFGYTTEQLFLAKLRLYAGFDSILLSEDITDAASDSIATLIQQGGYTTVVAGFFDMSRRPSRKYGLLPGHLHLLSSLYQKRLNTITVLFGNPYALEYFPEVTASLIAYDEVYVAQQLAAEALFGAEVLSGKLSVGVPKLPKVYPYYKAAPRRMGFVNPAEAGMNPAALEKIDSLAAEYIGKKALPGMAVLVMKGQNVVYDKGFGYTDYTRATPVDPYTDSYDLASVTKVAATTLSAMELFEEQKLLLTESIATYLPELKGTPKAAVTVQNLLLHDAGLPAWLPLAAQLIKDGKPDPMWVNETQSDTFSLPLTGNLWLHRDYPSRAFKAVLDAPLERKPGEEMVYSDLSMILLGKIIERITGKTLDTYTTEQFYRPLGMDRTAFLPAAKSLALVTPPTEEDPAYRQGRVEGYVNDANASTLGGYAGHAGLFSNVYDLAKLCLMLKNGGSYADKTIFDPFTVQYFTSLRSKNNRRGLGWDKPDVRDPKKSPTSSLASPETFGHLGFTGTAIWIDPTNDVVVIILANRTYPDPSNKTYATEGVRVKIMDYVYESLGLVKKPN